MALELAHEIEGEKRLALGYFSPWRMSATGSPENRKALLERAATDKIKLLGFHWTDPGVGYAERKDNAYRFVPAT